MKIFNIKLCLFGLVISTILSCSSTPEKEDKVNYDKEKLVKMSPLTQMFLNDFGKEYDAFNKSDNFIPSVELLEKYSLEKMGEVYFVSGLIKIDEFAGDVDFPGLKINTKAGNILTVKIPLNFFYDVIVNNKIKYIQIDEKVKRK